MTPADIITIVGVGIKAAVELGAVISKEQAEAAEKAAIASMKPPAKPLAKKYLDAIAEREKSDKDEVLSVKARMWASGDACEHCGHAALPDTDPAPPLEAHPYDDDSTG
jgi:primosomal protein N'